MASHPSERYSEFFSGKTRIEKLYFLSHRCRRIKIYNRLRDIRFAHILCSSRTGAVHPNRINFVQAPSTNRPWIDVLIFTEYLHAISEPWYNYKYISGVSDDLA